MIFVENTKEDVNISEMYGEECTLPKEKFIKKYIVCDEEKSRAIKFKKTLIFHAIL